MLERPADVPDAPGSYQFKDAEGRVIYVGKARSLRARLATYFGDPQQLHPRTLQMLERAASVEWIQVRSDVEAIMLEYNLIKQHRPRFNVRLVDDKSYPYLAVTVDERWPRAVVLRGAKRRGTRYFGPYAHAYAIRETLDLLLRSFPVRTCTDTKFRRHERLGRPCLLFHIERCSAPCIGAVDEATYRTHLEELMSFLEGDTAPVVERLEAEMLAAAEALEFERAARLRDQLASVRLASERQEMVAASDEDLDVVGIVDDDLEAAVQVLHVRRGRVVGRQGFVLEKVEPLGSAALAARVLEQHYAETPLGVAREVLVACEPDDAATYAAWLGERRGAKVTIRVPRRGRKRALLEVATANAAEQLQRHRTRRASDLAARAKALEELQAYLGLPEAPLRIECYDMSHLQGSDYVGSMVVMEDGLPKRSDYRRFKVAVRGNDDYAAMHEVLTRRLRRLDEEARRERDGRPRRFAYRPHLILLDGGRGQLGVGERVLAELGLEGRVALAALAKAFEEVHLPGRPEPVRIPRDSEAIYLLQQVRDEAHRFALGYHRTLRARRMTESTLDGVPGLGPVRRARLVRELGSLSAVRAATLAELLELGWLPDQVARALFEHLHPGAARRATVAT
ncbi:MAG TPA: excinuclease ABC subunit UvrC [Acidimicrobiales bacterium]|nr:excinuclease ABC subunit UvrC [Acidimicrobiales bacterium]